MEEILLAFLLTAATAIVLNVIFEKFGIPTIIGYIITGTVASELFELRSVWNLALNTL